MSRRKRDNLKNFKELDIVMSSIHLAIKRSNKNISKVNFEPFAKELQRVTKKVTGLHVEFFCNNTNQHSIRIPPIGNEYGKHTIFDSTDNLVDINRIKEEQIELLKGTISVVDTDHYFVSGKYSDLISTINIDYSDLFLKIGLNAREASAYVVRLIGQVFNVFATASKITVSNDLLSKLSMKMKDSSTSGHLDYFKSAYKADVIRKKDIPVVPDTPTVGYSLGITRIYIDSVVYIMGSHDTLSDDIRTNANRFALYHGYQRELPYTLDKAQHININDENVLVIFLGIISSILAAAVAIIFVITPILLVTSVPLLSAVIASIFLSLYLYMKVKLTELSLDMSSTREMDNLYREYISKLKERNLDTGEVKEIIKLTSEIDKLYDKRKASESLTKSLIDFFSSESGRRRKELDIKRTLDTLANNDLFLESERIKL